MKSIIRFSGAPRKNFPELKKLRFCLKETARLNGISSIILHYVFVPDEELLKINQKYLNHDEYTDIITFDMSDSMEEIEGEIYISRDRIIENAQQLGQTVESEFGRVIAHGLLHLCGFDDKNPAAKRKMTAAEEAFLSLYFSSSA